MKIHTLALAAIAISATAATAHSSEGNKARSELAQMVAHLESHYPGKVVAIEFDGAGDKGPHYHVDMSFPQSGMARVDVDAVTRAIEARDPDPLRSGDATLAEASALVAAHFPGQVTSAQLDAGVGATPHYDIDVRLPRGEIARVKLDPVSRQFGWRNPPILVD